MLSQIQMNKINQLSLEKTFVEGSFGLKIESS